HMLKRGEDYTWARPALHARKLRSLELKAGRPPRRGQPGSAQAYNLPATREAERRRATGGEAAYRRLTHGRGPTGAEAGAHGRAKGGTTIGCAAGPAPPCPALRHAVTHALGNNSIERRKGLFNIIR